MVALSSWLKPIVRKPGKFKSSIGIGDAFVFAYKPPRGEIVEKINQMPVFIVTRIFSSRIRGINLLAIRERNYRVKVLELYDQALKETDPKKKMGYLVRLERLLQSVGLSSIAVQNYDFNQIPNRAYPVERQELETLIKRVLK